jgi:protease-4
MENSYSTGGNQGAPNTPPPYFYMKPKRSRWWIPLSIIAAIIILILVVVVGIGIAFGNLFDEKPLEVKDHSVLYLHLNYDVSEYTALDPLSFFTSKKSASFLEILTSIEKAKTDDRIKGIYIKAENSQIGFAKSLELTSAIEEFKKSGKFVYGYLETGDEKDYMLTLPAQKITMPREGIMQIDGFGASSMFLKGFLDKIGVNFFVCGFEDFKSAGDVYARTAFSDSSKYQLQVYVDQLYGHFLNSIVHFRNLDKDKVNDLIDDGLYTAEALKSNGFIDEIDIESKVKDEMAKKSWGSEYSKDKKLQLVGIEDYVYSEPYKKDEQYDYDNQIGIVYGSGGIMHGDKQELFSSQKSIFAGQFIANLKKAVDNPKIKAIIIRIDSPGGSVLGSELIWAEIEKAKTKKPVYASMSDVAASGGYYIAMACDTIIAHPATITGSIGVISAIPNFSGAMKTLGITVDTISTNKNTHFMNPMLPPNDKDKAKFYELSKETYFRFVQKVANSRKMTFDYARSVAKGRVWTGADAKRVGIVDTLGDLRDAIKIAKRRIGVPLNKKVIIKFYPKPNDDMMTLFSFFSKSKENEEEQDASIESLRSLSVKLGKPADFLTTIRSAFPPYMQKQFDYNLSLLQMSYSENVLAALPYSFDVR